MLGYAPSVAQIGHEAQEKNTQHLIMVVAAAAAEMAMYEALSIAAAILAVAASVDDGRSGG